MGHNITLGTFTELNQLIFRVNSLAVHVDPQVVLRIFDDHQHILTTHINTHLVVHHPALMLNDLHLGYNTRLEYQVNDTYYYHDVLTYNPNTEQTTLYARDNNTHILSKAIEKIWNNTERTLMLKTLLMYEETYHLQQYTTINRLQLIANTSTITEPLRTLLQTQPTLNIDQKMWNVLTQN